MKLKDLGVYKIPSYYVCYFEYGDSGDMTDEEIQHCDEFSKDMGDSLVFDWDNGIDREAGELNDPYFSHNNDINGLGGDVIDCSIGQYTN